MRNRVFVQKLCYSYVLEIRLLIQINKSKNRPLKFIFFNKSKLLKYCFCVLIFCVYLSEFDIVRHYSSDYNINVGKEGDFFWRNMPTM